MDNKHIYDSDIHIINFYTRCFNFPYEELTYELQHLFRVLESEIEDEEAYLYVEQVLNCVNQYQGEEQQALRDEYNLLFMEIGGQQPLCPIVASTFLARYTRHYDADNFNDLLQESSLFIAWDEMGDTLTNQLEYLSILCDHYRSGEIDYKAFAAFLDEHILIWIPAFCDVLFKAANVTFYREIAEGLKYYIEDLASRFR
jgi:TorA maturation chaperone TorD